MSAPTTTDQRRDELIARIPTADPTREYVASGLYNMLSQAIAALPQYADDLTREQGDEVYERMRKDAAVHTAIQTLTEVVLAHKPRIESAVKDDTDPDFVLAQEVAEFVAYNIDRLDRPITQVLTEMLDAFIFGAGIAEKVYDLKITQKFGLRLHLSKLRPLARKNYAFVVDEYGNVAGFMVRRAGQGIISGFIAPELVVEREKFAVLQFGVTGGDPRGRSQIRAAYNAWWFKLQTFPRWLKYLQQFSTPSLVGYTPPDTDDLIDLKDEYGMPITNANGTPKQITKEQAMLNALVTFQGGSAMALKGGSKIDVIKSEGEGRAFIETIDFLNREIFLAVTGNARANMEAKNGSKADSESSMDSVSRKGDWIRGHVDEMLFRDVAKHLVALNWGEDIADRLTPIITLSAADKEDFAKIASGVAALWNANFFHKPSQVAGLDAMLNVPERDMDAWAAELADQQDQERQDALARQRVSLPGQGM
jgi:hypothetical protein